MMHRLLRLTVPLLAVVLAAVAMAPGAASAHETRTVGDYELTVGFINEPAIQNDTNGIWLRVQQGEEPVTGVSETLTAEVTYGDQTREAPLAPAFGEEGVYTSIFIPTEPGDYTFRFVGTIGDQEIDESFTSGPETFDSVAPRSEYEFPTGAHGDGDAATLAYPALIGGALLAAGAAGLAIRRARR